MSAELTLGGLLLSHLRAAAAILKRDWIVFTSYRTRLIGQLVSAVAMVAMFHFISQLVHVSMFQTSESYFGFAVVGVVTLEVLTSTLHTPPAAVRQELVAGTFERLVLSPFGGVMSTISMMVFPMISVTATGIVTLGAAAALFGLRLHWATVPLALPAALLGATSFMPFGIALAAVTLAFKQALSATTYIVAAIGLVAGFYFPVSLLPAWIRWTSQVQPFTPSVDLIRHLLLGSATPEPVALELAKIAGFSLVLLPVSTLMLAAALRLSQRRGTITEY